MTEAMFEALVLKVLISSPGDTGDEVAAVVESLHGWNGSRAESAQVILLPRQWKLDSVPRLGSAGGQGVINEQLVDDTDIVIALFDSRLGQATAAAVSGTAEEIQRRFLSNFRVGESIVRWPLQQLRQSCLGTGGFDGGSANVV
ncbi:hypothetical protein [Candidatus Mycobacterium methanotrophicum]|uniref:Uncharacterized protein n=1 Tax=Candidatus Mycobacterium methanotrophicum TaxID=2943498 RepID=A0ABY4QRP7_9MYCO|nr:hypothetical protein [Candidatus Mycobacterium methanotrophicum]UQX12265.1 hypothetical protein M5I08_08300 [Candidatus Mycobacterium methanotrophicum]